MGGARRILVDLGATALVGGCVVAALLVGSPGLPAARAEMPDTAAPPPVDPLLPSVRPGTVPVVRGSTVDGRELNADIRLSHQSVDALAEHYREVLSDQGIHVDETDVAGQHFVGGLAPDGHQVGVLLRPVADPRGGTETVVVPISARGTYRPGVEAGDLGLPLPPGHQVVSTGRSHAGASGATTAEILCNQSAEAVQAFYDAAMTARHYTRLALGGRIQGRADKALILRYRGPGGDLATVAIHRMDGGHAAVFLVHTDHAEVNTP